MTSAPSNLHGTLNSARTAYTLTVTLHEHNCVAAVVWPDLHSPAGFKSFSDRHAVSSAVVETVDAEGTRPGVKDHHGYALEGGCTGHTASL